MTTGTEVAKVDPKSTEVAAYDYGEDAGAGFENTTKSDFKTPFLRVLQPNSPQITTRSVPGAQAGQIINTVTSALFDDIVFIPSVTQHLFPAWKPRGDAAAAQGAFGGVYAPDDQLVLDAIQKLGGEKARFNRDQQGKIILPKTPDGEFDLVETYYVYGVQAIEETGAILPAVLTFSSTGIPFYQSWLTTANQERIPNSGGKLFPLFAHAYKLSTKMGQRGTQVWYNFLPRWWKGTSEKVPPSAVGSRLDPKGDWYLAARSIRELYAAGKVEVDHAAAGNAGGEGGTAPAGASQGRSDGSVPF